MEFFRLWPSNPLPREESATGSDTLEEQAPALLVNVMKAWPLTPVGICLLIRPDRHDCLATPFPWPLIIDVSGDLLSLSLSVLRYALGKQLKPDTTFRQCLRNPVPLKTNCIPLYYLTVGINSMSLMSSSNAE